MNQEEKITPNNWLLFAICFLTVAFGGIVSTLMSVYLPVAVKDLLGARDPEQLNTISSYINAVFILGGAFGGFIAGFISDTLGRKKSLLCSMALLGLSTLLTGYMFGWRAVVICRFFTGFGLGAVLVTTTTIMMEEWPPKTRAVFMGILSIAMPVGIFSAGVIDYFVSSWRQAFNVGILPLLTALLCIRLLKESAKWHTYRQATAVHPIKSGSIFSTAHRADLIKGSIIFGTMLIGLWAIFSWLPTWIQSLVIQGDARQQRGLSMMMLGMGGLAGGFASGWLINAVGLRRSLLLCFAVCTLCSFVLFKTNTFFSPVIYAEILVLSLSFGASQGVLSVYIPSLFPVGIRGTATGFCFNIGRLFTAAAVLFVGVLVAQLGGYGNALFLFSAVFPLGWMAVFLTREKVLPEAAQPDADTLGLSN